MPYSECCWCRPVGEVLPAVGSRPAVPARNAGPGDSAQQCIDGMRRASASSTPAIGDDTWTARLQCLPARACLPLLAVYMLRTYCFPLQSVCPILFVVIISRLHVRAN